MDFAEKISSSCYRERWLRHTGSRRQLRLRTTSRRARPRCRSRHRRHKRRSPRLRVNFDGGVLLLGDADHASGSRQEDEFADAFLTRRSVGLMRDRKRHDDHSDRALLTLNGKLAGRVAAPDFFGASQGVILHQDDLVGVEIIELDRAEDMPVQIFDADIDAVVGNEVHQSPGRSRMVAAKALL